MNSFRGVPGLRSQPGRMMRLAGAVLLLVALQAWAFQQSIAARETAAREHLQRLQQEVLDHRLLDGSLQALRDYWQAAGSEEDKRRALALRDTVLENFAREPRTTIDRFASMARELAAGSAAEKEAVDLLLERTRRLHEVYADHYAPLVNAGASPAWYFLPAALLEPGRRGLVPDLRFNRAVYLVLTGEYEGAAAVLDALLAEARSDRFRARVLYAQARLHYEAYRRGSDAGSFDDSLELTRQSITAGPGYTQPKLFLDYLLGASAAAHEMDTAPVRGTGTGEGEAERGSIVTGSDDF